MPGVAVSHSPLLLGTLTSCRGLKFSHRTVNPPPWHLVWGCRREGGSVGYSVTPGLGPQVQPCFNPANVLQIPALPLPSSLSFLVLVLGQEFGDAAASVPWERFDQGRGCWSSAVTEHLGPAHLSRGEGNIHLIIQLICCCDFPPGLGQTRVGP